MAQHDYNLSNNTGALYRADNNAVLQAIVTQNSGTAAPTVTFPGMLWLDLSGGGDGVMRRRNQANTAWLTDIGQDQIARDAAAAAQATANAAMPRTGGTFTGQINLPAGTPISNQAVSRAAGDALYQVRLPATQAGALLYGSASGWTASLAPAANDTVLVLSGGLPTWATGAVTAVPNAYVRTRSDGTLDPSLIPDVASGLRFRGTFKPAVNAEYPVTGGSGPVGAPAVGDFWVIDGLTTGGYTYLTGSLAGVTVYNGDSIAFDGETNWYRMGSTVNLQGYLKTDGSIAMTGNLNMGDQRIIEVGGITGRPGAPVSLSNFVVDSTNVVLNPYRSFTGADLLDMQAGQIGVDIGRRQLFVGTTDTANTPMLAVRFFSSNEAYAIGDHVLNGGVLYRARVAVSAGSFVSTQWERVLTASGTSADFMRADGTVSHSLVESFYEVSSPSLTAAGLTRPVVQAFGDNAAGASSIRLVRGNVSTSSGWLFRVNNGGTAVDAQFINPDGSLLQNGTINVSTGAAPSGAIRTILAGYTDNPAGACTISVTRGSLSTIGGLLFRTQNQLVTTDALEITADGTSSFGGVARPSTDNARALGTAALRWSVVYAGTGTINTSDARDKTPVRALEGSELSASLALARELGIYQWLAVLEDEGDAARLHSGVTSQRVEEVMAAHGLDAERYGFFCYDQWPAEPGFTDEAGNTTAGVEAGDRYGLRYDELFGFIIAGLASRVDALEQARNPT